MPALSPMQLFLVLLVFHGSATLAGARAEEPESAYDRVLTRALDGAQAELVRGIDLWVDHSTWENAWEVSSANYKVRTTESRFLAANVAEGLEVMLGHFQNILGTQYEPDQPFEVLIFPRLQDYNQFGDSVGAEHSSSLGNFYADQDPRLAVATYSIEHPTLLRMWITHSAAHQYIDRTYQAQLPPVLSEGLAQYFALYWDQKYARDEHRRLKDSPDYTPLAQLLFEQQGTLLADPDNRMMQLGLFFSYLIHYREDTRMAADGEAEPENSFIEYLRLALRGQDTSSSGFSRLLRDDLEALEEDFRAFDFPR